MVNSFSLFMYLAVSVISPYMVVPQGLFSPQFDPKKPLNKYPISLLADKITKESCLYLDVVVKG